MIDTVSVGGGGGQLRVILIDDERPCLEEMEYLLKDIEDIEVIGVYTDPLDALSAMRSSPPDAVFLDISMPHISGIELAEIIHHVYSDVEIVFVSAHARIIKDTRIRHPFEFLLKPTSPKKLNGVIKRLNLKRLNPR